MNENLLCSSETMKIVINENDFIRKRACSTFCQM